MCILMTGNAEWMFFQGSAYALDFISIKFSLNFGLSFAREGISSSKTLRYLKLHGGKDAKAI